MIALLAWIIRGALSDFDIERKIIDKIKNEFSDSDLPQTESKSSK